MRAKKNLHQNNSGAGFCGVPGGSATIDLISLQ